MPRRIVGYTVRLVAIALICGTAALAVTLWKRDSSARGPIDAAALKYHLDARRPAEFETLPVAPSADFAADVLGDAVLDDALGSVSLRDADERLRQLWIQSRMTLDGELADARDLLLVAAASRPGWSYHWDLLGRLDYLLSRRAFATDRAARDRWQASFDSALRSAPADRATAAFFAGAYLESWEALSPAEKSRFEQILPAAMQHPDFLALNVVPVSKLLGGRFDRLVPADPESLHVAMEAFAKAGEVSETARIFPWWERAEKRARAADLAHLRLLRDRYDVDALRAGCVSWVRTHPPSDFESASAIRQLAELLELWPGGERGRWDGDPRTAIIEHALAGRMQYFSPAVVERNIDELTNVPPAVRAEVYALADDATEAEELMKKAETAGAFEWTPVVVALARQEMIRGRQDLAAGWLAQLSPSASDECAPRILREEISKTTPSAEQFVMLSNDFTKEKSALLCVDPRIDRVSSVEATIRADAPALVDLAWNGGRVTTLFVNGRPLAVRLPLAGREGLHSLSAATRAGGSFAWRLRRVNER